MKRICLLLTIVFSLVFTPSAYALGTNVSAQYFYDSVRNEYLFYYWDYPTNMNTWKITFTAADNTIWSKDYGYREATGVYYITCNGQYRLDMYDSTGTRVAFVSDFMTSQIINPPCDSYSANTLKNDLHVVLTPQGANDFNADWTPVTGAAYYKLYSDGTYQKTSTATHEQVSKDHVYRIIAFDSNNNPIAVSDFSTRSPPTNSGGDDGTCDECSKLKKVLECPEWDTYMGELTGAIKRALPTLPEWRGIADQFVAAFSDYFGPVPDPPTVSEIANQITPQLPVLNTTVPEANIAPTVPSDYNQPMTFDITSGPQISVVDESQPIEIYEPDKYIKSDTPGEMVFPGDPRNNSDGIKNPDTIATPYLTPVPTKGSDYNTPPADIPIPSGSGGPGPIPTGSSGPGPVPNKVP